MSERVFDIIANEMMKEADKKVEASSKSFVGYATNDVVAVHLRKYAKRILEANCIENKHDW